jgi:hypothetical protein
MSFNITLSKGDIVVKENKRVVFVVRESTSWQHLLFIDTGYHTVSRYTYLYSNHNYIDLVEYNLMIEYTKIYLSGVLL